MELLWRVRKATLTRLVPEVMLYSQPSNLTLAKLSRLNSLNLLEFKNPNKLSPTLASSLGNCETR